MASINTVTGVEQWVKASNPFAYRASNPEAVKQDLRNYIAPVQLQRLRQDVLSWREVLQENENVWFPHRVKAQKLYIDTALNGHVYACVEKRKDLTRLRQAEFVDRTGKVDLKTTDIFQDVIAGNSQNKQWFNKFINHAWDSLQFGYTLITLGNIKNNEFPDLDIIKRWNVSPDRENVTNFVYSLSGANFLEQPYSDWHVYVKTDNDIGTSKAGYGFLYNVAIYEIFLRNLLGQNGDFVEMFAQPYRVGTTTKIGSERDDFGQVLDKMGSAGWALIDPEDKIDFIETALGGTGWKGYSDFEKRLEQKISKIILGHADSIDSVPGKLGNQNEGSPVQEALKAKKLVDGVYIQNVVNSNLIPKLRNLGFIIPEGVVMRYKNDAEQVEIQDKTISQAVEIKKAGLQVDAEEFTKKTGIKVTSEVKPLTPSSMKIDVKNKLEKLYSNTGCNCKH